MPEFAWDCPIGRHSVCGQDQHRDTPQSSRDDNTGLGAILKTLLLRCSPNGRDRGVWMTREAKYLQNLESVAGRNSAMAEMRQLRSWDRVAMEFESSTPSAIMDTTNQEQAFSDKIDGKFPYSDASKAAALIAEARSISTNAEFCVLYEIISPPAAEGLA